MNLNSFFLTNLVFNPLYIQLFLVYQSKLLNWRLPCLLEH